MIILVYYDYDL